MNNLGAGMLTTPIRAAIDLSFGQLMSVKEHKSLARQIIRTYGHNNKRRSPLSLHLTSVAAARADAPDSLPPEHMLRSWLSPRSPTNLFHLHDDSPSDTWPASEVVWLSPDAEAPLEALDASQVYVIGGLVDRFGTQLHPGAQRATRSPSGMRAHRSVKKGASLTRAQACGAVARRLPVREFASRSDLHPILTGLSVCEILMDVHSGISWEAAFARHVPRRAITRREQEEAKRRAQQQQLVRMEPQDQQ